MKREEKRKQLAKQGIGAFLMLCVHVRWQRGPETINHSCICGCFSSNHTFTSLFDIYFHGVVESLSMQWCICVILST
jgi:hypothetical protein